MPRATVSRDTTDKIMLASCPDGFIMLRRLSYGEFLRRQELGMEMAINSKQGSKDNNLDLKMMQRAVQEFEFKNCIVDHNLEDDNGNPLDFRLASTIDNLDPRIGQEIGKHIDQLIQFEEALGN